MNTVIIVIAITLLFIVAGALLYMVLPRDDDEGWINVDGLNIQTDDPLMAQTIAESWRTGKTVIGTVEENGTFNLREHEEK